MVNHIIKASLEQGVVITIIYAKENVITKRDIRVLEINDNSIKAYCYLRQQNRTFKKENILAADYCSNKVFHE